MMAEMMAGGQFRVATFDCYGTLVDWEGGAGSFLYQLALRRGGEPPGRVLHIAFGFKYDIAPAQAMGCRAAWVNRFVEPKPGPAVPDYAWRDLWGLAELVGGAGPVPPSDAPSSAR